MIQPGMGTVPYLSVWTITIHRATPLLKVINADYLIKVEQKIHPDQAQ